MPRKLFTILVFSATIVLGFSFMGKYSPKRFIFFGDVMGYYVYLPAAVIYHNLRDMEQIPQEAGLHGGVYYYTALMKEYSTKAGLDHWLNQYTYPVALMESPFFISAHLYEKFAGLPANGYSDTYKIAISLSSLVYTLLGMLLLFRLLRRYFSYSHSLLSLVLILLGTNMFWFTFGQAGMSHIPLFFLYALLMYLTVKLYERATIQYFIAIGFVAGLITIMRPSDIISVLIPLLYGVYNKATLWERLHFLQQHFSKLLIAAVVFLLPAVPQLLYWKYITGSYFYYSYMGQSFNWTKPKIIEGLFLTANGWLPYAPIMICAIAGLLLMRKGLRVWLTPVLVILPVYIYIIYSWYCYNYINGFGSRPMIHLYPLLAIPLAAFVRYVAQKGIVIKGLFTVFCVACIWAMYSLTCLQAQKKFDSQYSRTRGYLNMLFKNKLTYKDMLVADLDEFQPDTAQLVKIRTLAYNDFNTPHDEHYVPDPNDADGYVYHVKNGEEYFPDKIKLEYKQSDFTGVQWLKCSGRFMRPEFANHNPHFFIFGVLGADNNYVHWKPCKTDNKIGLADGSCPHAADNDYTLDHVEYGLWGYVYFYVKVPDNLQEGQVITLDIWNMGKVQFYLDDFKIELYK